MAKSKSRSKSKSRTKKLDGLGIFCLIAILATAVATVVFMFLKFVNWSVLDEVMAQFGLFDLAGLWGIMSMIFAVIAVISCVLLIFCALMKLFNAKNTEKFTSIVSFAALISGVLLLISLLIGVGSEGFILDGALIDEIGKIEAVLPSSLQLSVFAYLMPVCAILCGAVSFFNKKK